LEDPIPRPIRRLCLTAPGLSCNIFSFSTGVYSSGSSICGAEEKWRTEELSTDDDEIDDDDDDDDDERAAAGVIVVAATALFIVATALAARRQIIEDNILFVWFVLYER